MKIGELASSASCDVQTVRFYERTGLLSEPPREASGYRRYGPEHLERLNFIRHCRSLDIPLAEVRQLLAYAAEPGPSCGPANDLLDRHVEWVQSRIRSLGDLEAQLLDLRKTCDGKGARPCPILQSLMAPTRESACACHPQGSD